MIGRRCFIIEVLQVKSKYASCQDAYVNVCAFLIIDLRPCLKASFLAKLFSNWRFTLMLLFMSLIVWAISGQFNYICATLTTRWCPWGIQILVSTCVLGQDLPKFIFSLWGGGYSGQVKSEKSWSAKICLNFNFRGGGGGVFWASQNWKVLKCQDLPKFQFSGGGGRGGEGGKLGTKSQE